VPAARLGQARIGKEISQGGVPVSDLRTVPQSEVNELVCWILGIKPVWRDEAYESWLDRLRKEIKEEESADHCKTQEG
jgi:hypothetical protein